MVVKRYERKNPCGICGQTLKARTDPSGPYVLTCGCGSVLHAPELWRPDRFKLVKIDCDCGGEIIDDQCQDCGTYYDFGGEAA